VEKLEKIKREKRMGLKPKVRNYAIQQNHRKTPQIWSDESVMPTSTATTGGGNGPSVEKNDRTPRSGLNVVTQKLTMA